LASRFTGKVGEQHLTGISRSVCDLRITHARMIDRINDDPGGLSGLERGVGGYTVVPSLTSGSTPSEMRAPRLGLVPFHPLIKSLSATNGLAGLHPPGATSESINRFLSRAGT
jgi:hypothetical protein